MKGDIEAGGPKQKERSKLYNYSFNEQMQPRFLMFFNDAPPRSRSSTAGCMCHELLKVWECHDV